MSEPVSRNGGYKTLGIKIPDPLHAQLSMICTLDEMTLGDAAVRAVELFVAQRKQEAGFAEKAREAQEAIEREAAVRKAAIEALFTAETQAAPSEAKPKRRSSGQASGS